MERSTGHPEVADASGRVCAIVVTRDRCGLLAECLDAIRAQTRPVDQIVVVDNASTDETQERLARDYPGVVALRLRQNVGGAGGFNVGLRWAFEREYDWLWLLDDDTIAAPDALEQLFGARDRFPTTERPSLLASRVLWTDGSLHFMNMSVVKATDISNLFASVEHGTLSIRSTTFVSCLIERELVSRHGFPIPGYFIWVDDTEYTARLLRDSLGVMVPRSVVVHKTPARHTPIDAPPERYYLYVRNNLWMLTRSNAWSGKEKLRHLVTVCAWIGRYFARHGLSLAAAGAIARAVVDGIFRAPPVVDPLRFCETAALVSPEAVAAR